MIDSQRKSLLTSTLLVAIVLLALLVLMLSSCSGTVPEPESGVEQSEDTQGVAAYEVIEQVEYVQDVADYEVEHEMPPYELPNDGESDLVSQYSLEHVSESDVTVHMFVGSRILEVAIIDVNGNRVNYLPYGYEVRWSLAADDEVYVDFRVNVGTIGINAWIVGSQITTQPIVVTAQLYSLKDEDVATGLAVENAIAVFDVVVEYRFHPKYHTIIIDASGKFSSFVLFQMIGFGHDFSCTNPNIWGLGSEGHSYPITLTPENRIIIHTEGSPLHNRGASAYVMREITDDLWERHRIQAFVFGGDITLISQYGILSQFSELHEDNFYFELTDDGANGDFEIQYILYHEIPYSSLLRLFGLTP